MLLQLTSQLFVTLHSILVIFQSRRKEVTTKHIETLHSILVIFQFYKSRKRRYRDTIFTFHSGYIPIVSVGIQMERQDAFTFHSGYIPILLIKRQSLIIHTLHSILVIFQWTGYKIFIVIYFFFTFHSGYIPIGGRRTCCRCKKRALHSILVIFQFNFTDIVSTI